MALTPADLGEIDALLGAPDASGGAVAALRARFPKSSLTCASSSDLGVEAPFRQYKQFDLYLVDGGSHCWNLTQDPGLATGLVVVAHERSS